MRVGPSGIQLDLGAKALHVHVERLGVAVVVGTPHAVDEHVTREHPPGVREQELEQLELLQRKCDPLATDLHFMAGCVEAHVTDLDHVGVVLEPAVVGTSAPQGRPHAGDQLAQPERLGDVVVGTHLQADHRIDLRVACGHHDDGHLRLRPDLPAHVDAGDAREHHVEQHQAGADGIKPFQRVGAVDRDLNPEPLAFERDPQRVAVRLFVVDNEDQRSFGHQGRSS